MSMPTAILTADPDDFRQWEAEFGPADVEPLTGPKIPAQRSRAADHRDAQEQIVEGYLEWLHARREA
jgi:hypothetical protein